MLFSMSGVRNPGGAMTAVISDSPEGPRYLLLHNAETTDDGDWAWGSPSGCLEPGEDIAGCAARELFEETGIRGEPIPVITEDIDWAVFRLRVPWLKGPVCDEAAGEKARCEQGERQGCGGESCERGSGLGRHGFPRRISRWPTTGLVSFWAILSAGD
jgi:8-oxo-dGTP pyrophosphatase MutT (NUDIX family)